MFTRCLWFLITSLKIRKHKTRDCTIYFLEIWVEILENVKILIKLNHNLKFVFTTFSLVCFLSLKESSCKTKKMFFYFTSKTLYVLKKIKF